MSQQLFIAGFHRSGTSLLAQLLHRAGLFLGDDLLGADPSNPYGHYEDRAFLELHRTIMEEHGETWQVTRPVLYHIAPRHWAAMRELVYSRNLHHRFWGFKDPRSAFFLGAWKHLAPTAKVVVIYRDYGGTSYSLGRRHSASAFRGEGPTEQHLEFWRHPDHALHLWISYNQALISFIRNHRQDTIVVSFDALARGYPIVRELDARFDLGLTPIPTGAVFDQNVTHARPDPQPLHEPSLRPRIERTWDALAELDVSNA